MRAFCSNLLVLNRCHIRVIDTFGTEPAYNHEEYATLHGYRTNWGYWNLNARQYMTMFRKNKDYFSHVLHTVNVLLFLSIGGVNSYIAS